MLDDNEYGEASRLYSQCMSATKEFRQRWGVPTTGRETSTNVFARFGIGMRN